MKPYSAVVWEDVEVGDKIQFASERLRYTVQARGPRFLVCTKPFNPRHTVLYTVVDLQEGVRGTENLIFGFGAETREQCEEMLARLEGRYPAYAVSLPDGKSIDIPACHTEVSHRNRVRLDAVRHTRVRTA